MDFAIAVAILIDLLYASGVATTLRCVIPKEEFALIVGKKIEKI
jgi:hypothetical protein